MELDRMGDSAIGEAARAGALSRSQLEGLLPRDLSRFASNSVRCRLAMVQATGVTAELLDELLNHRGAWAIEQLIQTCRPEELVEVEKIIEDSRLYRIERHELREALRVRKGTGR